jgi:hypothetical protein
MLELVRIEAGETDYFLVGYWLNGRLVGSSYVLPLSRPEDIAHARYLVSLGPAVWDGPESTRPLVVAKIAYKKDGINRDYMSPTFREWSWHVVEFLAFADVTVEVLDGSPWLVEQGDFAGGETIGFWSFTVVRELGPVPLYLSVIPEALNLQFHWSGLGTNYVYTLESNESLTGADWAPVPGAFWPLATNHWTVSLTNAPASLYRVKAQESE